MGWTPAVGNAQLPMTSDATALHHVGLTGYVLIPKAKQNSALWNCGQGDARHWEANGRELKSIHFIAMTQRVGIRLTDRTAARFATAALDAIDNNETYVMTALVDGMVKSVPLSEMVTSGEILPDPNIPDMSVANAFVPLDSPLLATAVSMGVYVGEIK